MKHQFQAKDIQRILKITKIRYEYLTSKIDIKPGVEEVEGTGKAHLYSFKNLLQIAVAHNANKMGLSLRLVKKLLINLENYNDEVESGIFDHRKDTNLKIYVAYHGEFPIIYIVGGGWRYYADITGKLRELEEESEKLSGKNYEAFKEHQGFYIDVLTDIASVVENFPPDPKVFKIWLDVSDGYVTINLGNIKKRIIAMFNE